MIRIEIRPGEGGADAKLLVRKQADIYRAYAMANGLSFKKKAQKADIG